MFVFHVYKIESKEIEPDQEPTRGMLWVEGRKNKDAEYHDDETRSVGEKFVSFTAYSIILFNVGLKSILAYMICIRTAYIKVGSTYNNLFPILCVQKETEEKITQGTLKVDHGTDAMTVVLGKEKGGYARGVGGGVIYKKYFDLPRIRQAADERVVLLQTELDNERRKRQEKDAEIQALRNQLAAQRGQLQSTSTPLTSTPLTSTEVTFHLFFLPFLILLQPS